MKRPVLIGGRMKSHQRGCDRQLTQRGDTMSLATVGSNWFWKHSKLIHFSILWLIITFYWFVLIYPISLVSSIVDVERVSTRKKQQNKRFFSQLSERDTDFMIGQSNQDEQTGSRDKIICRGTSSDNASNSTQINYPQVDVHTLAEKIVRKVRSEVGNVMTSVETGIQDRVLTAIENLAIPWVELDMKSANAPSE